MSETIETIETIDDNVTFSSSNNDELNNCIFINTNNPKVKNQAQKKTDPIPLIKLPFPPLVDPKDLLIIGKDNKPTRSPNAFIIYRKVFFKTIKNEGHVLPMTSISSMASQSWEQESDEVKKYYKRLAKEAYNYRNELFPKKVNKRKKREKWNIISFKSNDSASVNNNNGNNNNSNDNDDNNDNNFNDSLFNMEDVQLPTPVDNASLIDAFMQLNNKLNNVLLQNLILSNELSLSILNNSNNGINDISTNFDNDVSDFLNFQEEPTYPSPNLSLTSDESNLASPNLDELNELINSPFPIENLQQIENNNNEEIQQSIVGDLEQQFLFSQDSNDNNDNHSIDLNSFDDNLNAFFDDLQPNFSDYLNDDNDKDIIIANDTNAETPSSEDNSIDFTNFTQYEDDLGITFVANEELEKFFSL